jgi:hypothetical protein
MTNSTSASNRSVSASRPKKSLASALSKARSPLYGFTKSRATARVPNVVTSADRPDTALRNAETKDRAESVEVDVADTANAPTVRTYGVSRAPLPLVLVVAPNGAVTAGFPGACDPQALADALVGPLTATCLKALQDGKVVLICVQNGGSRNAEAALKTVAAFKADQRIKGFAESVVIDPTDGAEKSFLNKLRVDPTNGVATTVLVAPPGRVAGTYTNVVTAEAMFTDLSRAMAGATCGSGGCGPAAGGCQ